MQSDKLPQSSVAWIGVGNMGLPIISHFINAGVDVHIYDINQANIKLANEIIAEQEKTIAELTTKNESAETELEKLKTSKSNSHNAEISQLQKRIEEEVKNSAKLNTELSELKLIRSQNENIKNQYEAVKNQVNHLETFKSELAKSREETEKVKKDYEKIIFDLKQKHQNGIDDLNKKIEYLQLTPAKRKKIGVLNNKSENTLLLSTDTKDGGSF